jgi:hypothetical protein
MTVAPNLIERYAVLAPVKTALRRLGGRLLGQS